MRGRNSVGTAPFSLESLNNQRFSYKESVRRKKSGFTPLDSKPRSTTNNCAKHLTGFTLLEIIIAMTIFALLASLIYNSFSLGISSWEKTNQQTEITQRVRVSLIKLIEKINQSYTDERDEKIYFKGGKEHLTFYSLGSETKGLAKMEFFRDSREKTLVFKETPLQPGIDYYRAGKVTPLVSELEKLEFSFYDHKTGWTNAWDSTISQKPPAAVRMEISMNLSFKSGEKQEFIFPSITVSINVGKSYEGELIPKEQLV